MDSDNEDVLQLGVEGQDLEGMELDDPISGPSHRDGGERSGQAPTTVSKSAVNRGGPIAGSDNGAIPSGEITNSEAGRPARKKKWKSKNPTVLERQRLRRKEKKALWKQKAKKALQARVAAATRGSSEVEPSPGPSGPTMDDSVRARIFYDELLPSSIGTYYHPRPAPLVRNLLPAGYYSDPDEDAFEAEAMLEPEDRPWMKGHKRPLAPPIVAVEPQRNSEGVELVERARQRYYESPSTKLAKYTISKRMEDG